MLRCGNSLRIALNLPSYSGAMGQRMKTGWTIAGTAVAAIASGAIGATNAPVSPNLAKVLGCRAISAPDERLTCFDREVTTLGDHLAKGQVVVVDTAQVREARRARFGLAAPGLELFAGKDGQPVSRVTATVAGASTDGYGKLLVSLADGSRWRQIDDYTLGRTPRAGDAAVITRAAIGSFKMTIAGQAAIRVRRER